MIDDGKPFDIDALRKTMPWQVTLTSKGKIVMIDNAGREVSLVDMVNFTEHISQRLASK